MQKLSPKNFKSWNEEMAKRYDPDLYLTGAPLPIRLIEKMRIKAAVSLLNPQLTDYILEVGCGAGNVLEQISCAKLYGIDISKYLLSKAHRKLGSKATIMKMKAEELAFKDISFDKILCTEVLEHVLSPKDVLLEIKRALKPNGFAVVSIPNEPLINRLKRIAFAIPALHKVINKLSVYKIPTDMSEEWHLHEFDYKKLLYEVQDLFRITRVRAIPSRCFPLRYVAKLIPSFHPMT